MNIQFINELEKASVIEFHTRFWMVTAGKRNKVMMLDKKSYDPSLIEDPALFTVEISKHQKYG